MDFGIGAIFEEFDKRLGRRVSNLIIVCVAILLVVMTIRVILETILAAGMALERLGALSDSENTRDLVLYIAGRFLVFLILLAGFVVLMNALSRRFLKKLSVSLDNHKAMTEEFLRTDRELTERQKDFTEKLFSKAEELDRREQEISAREKKLVE